MVVINPVVADISHYDRVLPDGFQQARRFGLIGIIQKSSEGLTIIDRPYADRVVLAVAAGLEVGAYHFLRPGNMKAQAEFWLSCAKPTDKTLMSLDFEVPNVPIDAAREFIEYTEAKIGRDVVLYSGNTAKEDLGNKLDTWWGDRRLWLAMYSRTPVVQRSWKNYWLWQYTGDGLGLQPHNVPGIQIEGGLDISTYDGTEAQLRAEWAGRGLGSPPMQPPAFIQDGIASYYSIADNGGTTTASGIPLDDKALTAAHRTLRFGTVVKVTRKDTGATVTVKITDRGPFVAGRIIDLTLAGAKALDMIAVGLAPVHIETVQ